MVLRSIIESLFSVIKNIFICNDGAGHEIVYIFTGKFLKEEMYILDECFMTEADGTRLPCAWIKLDDFKTGQYRLTSETLLQQLV